MNQICDVLSKGDVNRYLERAITQLGLTPETGCLLALPYRELSIELPLRCDDGKLAVYYGYRVQHSKARGPFKGGLRFHRRMDLEHARELASIMTWKTALTNLPFGGAKGGINCDPAEVSIHEKEQLTKRFIDRLGPLIGPNVDILAPDMGTSPREMAWIYQAYSDQQGDHWSVVTGKPVALQGCRGRTEATGKGVALVTRWATEAEGINLGEASVAIQGFGNVGAHAAKLLNECGARIIAISDSKTTLFNGDGLDVKTISDQMVRGTASGLAEVDCQAEALNSGELTGIPCDVLIPAAIGRVITETNAAAIPARLIVEAANLPVTYEGDCILNERGIPVIPDILANAGGVIVSYLEWSQNHQRRQFRRERVDRYLEQTLKQAWKNIGTRVKEKRLTYREIAYQIAVKRVSNAIEARGF